MQILGVKKYSHGYSGCLANACQYVFFYFVNGHCKPYHHYPKNQFRDYHHFISVMAKFVPRAFFLRQPVTVDGIDQATLEHLAVRRKEQTFSSHGKRSHSGPPSAKPRSAIDAPSASSGGKTR